MRNNENHIFIDTNCLIGSLCEKYGLHAVEGKENTTALHYLSAMNGKKLYVSSLAVAQLTAKCLYIMTNNTKDCATLLNVIPFKPKQVRMMNFR